MCGPKAAQPLLDLLISVLQVSIPPRSSRQGLGESARNSDTAHTLNSEHFYVFVVLQRPHGSLIAQRNQRSHFRCPPCGYPASEQRNCSQQENDTEERHRVRRTNTEKQIPHRSG